MVGRSAAGSRAMISAPAATSRPRRSSGCHRGRRRRRWGASSDFCAAAASSRGAWRRVTPDHCPPSRAPGRAAYDAATTVSVSTPPRTGPPRRSDDFQDLMRHRIMDILLVASPYDTFLLEEAGQLSERMLGEFRNLDLHYGPGLTGVATGRGGPGARPPSSGASTSSSPRPHVADMDAAELARRVREAGLGHPGGRSSPGTTASSRTSWPAHDASALERVFLWQGDARILLAIVKSVEDRRNVEHDTGAAGVQVILLVEDNVRYYSSFLPDDLRRAAPPLAAGDRRGAQPLAEDPAHAGAAQDPPLPDLRGGVERVLDATGKTCWASSRTSSSRARAARRRGRPELARAWCASPAPTCPILLHSSRPENEALARAAGADFLLKGSPVAAPGAAARSCSSTSASATSSSACPDGREVGRAADLREPGGAARAPCPRRASPTTPSATTSPAG